MKWSTSAIVLISSLLAAQGESVLRNNYCVAYSKVFGSEGLQVTDDSSQALLFKDFLQEYPNFDFHLDIFSDFTFDGVVNEEETKYVQSSMLKVQMHNWNDFAVYLSQFDEPFNLQLEDFTGATHGDQSKSHDILRH